MIPHVPKPGIHIGDFVACGKVTEGHWYCDTVNGEIYSTRTGRKVRFHKSRDGYLRYTVHYRGLKVSLLKHRAVYVIANLQYGIPIDLSLEVDHINHDKTDCRIENLRLVTRTENERSKPPRVPDGVVRAIRRRYAAGDITQKKLSEEYGLSQSTVSRIVLFRQYARVNEKAPQPATPNQEEE